MIRKGIVQLRLSLRWAGPLSTQSSSNKTELIVRPELGPPASFGRVGSSGATLEPGLSFALAKLGTKLAACVKTESSGPSDWCSAHERLFEPDY